MFGIFRRRRRRRRLRRPRPPRRRTRPRPRPPRTLPSRRSAPPGPAPRGKSRADRPWPCVRRTGRSIVVGRGRTTPEEGARGEDACARRGASASDGLQRGRRRHRLGREVDSPPPPLHLVRRPCRRARRRRRQDPWRTGAGTVPRGWKARSSGPSPPHPRRPPPRPHPPSAASAAVADHADVGQCSRSLRSACTSPPRGCPSPPGWRSCGTLRPSPVPRT
mmetsp:Transcript_38057/g.113653  ORF Transcript_38057/g.113653 Transcript_38057/m.113653 type:complete len:220 (+) Transcript_38057:539-1198(+)